MFACRYRVMSFVYLWLIFEPLVHFRLVRAAKVGSKRGIDD